MKRHFTNYLIEWKNRKWRKPLIVRGARQVGKTFCIKQFAAENFEEFVMVNFEEQPDLVPLFKTNNVVQIIQNLEIYFGKKIIQGKCLLFLDEIQICPEAITGLRYFYENLPDIHIIAAGSLLDHTLNEMNYSMPVGRIEFAYMHPFSFYEFLTALNHQLLVDYLLNSELKNPISEPIHSKLLGLLRIYYLVGGMPEAVRTYVETNSLIEVSRVHESILKSLEFDFSKYGTRNQQTILTDLLRYIPKAIGQKFKYSNFNPQLRSDAIKTALKLLQMSRLIYLVRHTKANGIPLEHVATEKIIKPLFLDIGLVNHALKLKSTAVEPIEMLNAGRLAEQFVGQEIICKPPYFSENEIYYWVRENKNSEAEIDYVLQESTMVVPIEVKAGKTGTLKSLQVFMYEKKLKKALRFNTDLPSVVQIKTELKIENNMHTVDFQLISLPLYLVNQLNRFI